MKQLLTTVEDGEPSIHYRLGHPLAEVLISQSKSRRVAPREVTFLCCQHGTRITSHPKTPPLDARPTLSRGQALRGHDGDCLVFRHSRESGNPVSETPKGLGMSSSVSESLAATDLIGI